MVLCKNSVFEKKMKPNWARYHKNLRRWDGAIGIKLFLTFFSPQMEGGALGVERIYKAGAERVNISPISTNPNQIFIHDFWLE